MNELIHRHKVRFEKDDNESRSVKQLFKIENQKYTCLNQNAKNYLNNKRNGLE